MQYSKENIVTDRYELEGRWSLYQTELYTNDSLVGTGFPEDSSIIYEFISEENEVTNRGILEIFEDGFQETYTYEYDEASKKITTDSNLSFDLVSLTETHLTLSNSYSNHRSEYYFKR